MWSRRRRRSVPPVLLPSLDRLSTLIERVVELIDAVSATQESTPEPDPEPAREPVPEPARELSAVAAGEGEDEVWLAFVPSPHGYALIERRGVLPLPGKVVALDDGRYRVLRLAPSPLPGDGRRCAYLEREEAPPEDRSFDG